MKRFALVPALLLLAGPALGGPPAAIAPDSGRNRAESSFEEFAEDWMAKVRALEQKHRSNPTIKQGASEPLVTYRGYGEGYSVELRPTGNARAPYVGLLRYTEHVYSCRDMDVDSCTVASTVPVTEIFRYQDGRWNY
jgi:hypothetical protein